MFNRGKCRNTSFVVGNRRTGYHLPITLLLPTSTMAFSPGFIYLSKVFAKAQTGTFLLYWLS
jgi:hypothetical protein